MLTDSLHDAYLLYPRSPCLHRCLGHGILRKLNYPDKIGSDLNKSAEQIGNGRKLSRWYNDDYTPLRKLICFALRDIFAKRTKFRVVQTGPKNNPANHAPGRCRGNDEELIKSNCLRGPAFLYERIFHFKEEKFSIFRYEILESRLLCARPQSRRSLATSTACQGSPTGKGQSDW